MNPKKQPSELDRRKTVRLRRRMDLVIAPQKYEGRTFFVVKDPVSLRYYRFKEQEHFLLQLMDGGHTLDDAQKAFEARFPPERLKLEDLEQFGQQLLNAGLVQNESPHAGKVLFDNRQKKRRLEMFQTFSNILYIKIPVFDPEKILRKMVPWAWWMFTVTFLLASTVVMLSALFLVLSHFDNFYSRLPSYQEFFSFKNVIYLWAALGVVKVIHEFGHGLSCKAFGGEVHEMGFLLLCFSPAMYCNVSDAWTLPNKWHRIIISAAGIYVELMIAAFATFIWWNTSSWPFVNHLSLSLMVVCSVSTVVFNGNPLMRYDGYYVLADWLEIPNLRDRANRYLQNLAMEYCLGIEVQPEPYMDLWRRVLFVIFAVISYLYRWVVTFVILKFMASFLRPYKLEVISNMLALAALASMIGWPLYRLLKNVHKRGRLPDMKTGRVTMSAAAVVLVLSAIFFLPMPVTRVRKQGVVQVNPNNIAQVHIRVGGILEKILVQEGQLVKRNHLLAIFRSRDLDLRRDEALALIETKKKVVDLYEPLINRENDPRQRAALQEQRSKAENERKQAENILNQILEEMKQLELRAPRDGVVLGSPPKEEIGKRWDKEDKTLFCSIGDRTKLRVLVPVNSFENDLVRENYAKRKLRHQPLAATIRVQGREYHTWTGVVVDVPESEAKEIPLPLSNKGGGPLAVRPSSNPNQLIPQEQVFLVGVDIEGSDDTIAVGTMAQVKIHCDYRSCAWWVWRAITSAFDLPLL